MRTWRWTRRLAATAAALIAGAWACGAAAAPALWVVRDADSTIYLFGTMHILSPDAQWRTPAFEAAYKAADAVWFETDPSPDPAEVTALMQRYGVDERRPLSRTLDRSTLERLKVAARRTPLRFAELDRLRPWAAALMMTVAPMLEDDLGPASGADMAIGAQGDADGKPVKAFESLETQIRMFAGLPESVQVAFLRQSLPSRRAPAPARALQAAWTQDGADEEGRLLLADMRRDQPALYDALIARRNRQWAQALTTEMGGQGTELVNVGALHLVGDEGLPALMRARGFEVERVQ